LLNVPLLFGSAIVCGFAAYRWFTDPLSQKWGAHIVLTVMILWALQYFQWKRQFYEELHDCAWDILVATERRDTRDDLSFEYGSVRDLAMRLYAVQRFEGMNPLRKWTLSRLAHKPSENLWYCDPVLEDLGVRVRLDREKVTLALNESEQMRKCLTHRDQARGAQLAKEIRELLAQKPGTGETVTVPGVVLGWLVVCLREIASPSGPADLSDLARKVRDHLRGSLKPNIQPSGRIEKSLSYLGFRKGNTTSPAGKTDS